MEKCSEHEESVTEAILAFDTLYTTNHMKILKLLFPYLEQQHQSKLAVYIKWQELIFTLNFFKQYPKSYYIADLSKPKKWDLNALLPLVTPYCSESEKNLISQFSQLQNMMNMMNDMQQYMPLIQQFMSSMSGSDGNKDGSNGFDTSNMMDMFKNMMSEEQQNMFSMFMNGG